jgi:hypothetical protein
MAIEGLIILGLALLAGWVAHRALRLCERPDWISTTSWDWIQAVPVVVFLLAIAGVHVARERWGVSRPGAFFEKAAYQREFYVNLFSDGEQSLNHRVPAGIRAYSESIPVGDDKEGTWRVYCLDYIRLADARVLKFACPQPGWGSRWLAVNPDIFLEVGKKKRPVDARGRTWAVELTDQPAD